MSLHAHNCFQPLHKWCGAQYVNSNIQYDIEPTLFNLSCEAYQTTYTDNLRAANLTASLNATGFTTLSAPEDGAVVEFPLRNSSISDGEVHC